MDFVTPQIAIIRAGDVMRRFADALRRRHVEEMALHAPLGWIWLGTICGMDPNDRRSAAQAQGGSIKRDRSSSGKHTRSK